MEHAHNREFSRSPSHREVEVACGEGILKGFLRDVSLNGFFVVCEEPFSEATVVSVALGFDGESNIEIMGRVMRSDEDGMAIEIDELGIESYQHLKRLVLLNSESPDKTEREIADHLGLKSRN